MKKRILIVTLIVALIALPLLTACGGSKGPISGTYTCEISGIVFSTMTFKGDRITQEYPNSGNRSTGTYELNGNKISVSWDDGKKDTFNYDSSKEIIEFAGLEWKK